MITQLKKPLKQFLLFGGEAYYPHGAFCDFIDSFDSIEDAKIIAEKLIQETDTSLKCSINWYQIVDTINLKILSYELPYEFDETYF